MSRLQSKKGWKGWAKITLIPLMFLIFMGLMFWQVQVLTLRTAEERGGELRYFKAVQPGDQINLRFLHSYERGWVEETYRVDKKDFIYPVEHRYQVFNYDARENTYPGDFRLGDDGYAYVNNIDKYELVPIHKWRILVAYEVPQILSWEGEEISLPDFMPSGSIVALQVERWGLSRYLFKTYWW